MAASLQNLICPGVPMDQSPSLLPVYRVLLFGLDKLETSTSSWDVSNAVLLLWLVPIFLWITDAFLLYRAWIIWIQHRVVIIIPALVFLASIVSGIIWLVQGVRTTLSPSGFDSPGSLNLKLALSLSQWIPTLSFSCGLDALTTGMIAGRLICQHRKQKKFTESRTTFYMPVVTIFIESAALSLISKILQLAVPSQIFAQNPLVIPICTISSNLIVLRKALGADAGEMMNKKPEDLSALRFCPRRRGDEPQASETRVDASIPGGFGAHLIQTIGGHTIDIGPFDDENSRQFSSANVPKDS